MSWPETCPTHYHEKLGNLNFEFPMFTPALLFNTKMYSLYWIKDSIKVLVNKIY